MSPKRRRNYAGKRAQSEDGFMRGSGCHGLAKTQGSGLCVQREGLAKLNALGVVGRKAADPADTELLDRRHRAASVAAAVMAARGRQKKQHSLAPPKLPKEAPESRIPNTYNGFAA